MRIDCNAQRGKLVASFFLQGFFPPSLFFSKALFLQAMKRSQNYSARAECALNVAAVSRHVDEWTN
jgi:hypothetical protein